MSSKYEDMTSDEKIDHLEKGFKTIKKEKANLEKQLKQSDNSKLAKLNAIRGDNIVLDQTVLQVALETYLNQDLSINEKNKYQNLIIKTSRLLTSQDYKNEWMNKEEAETEKSNDNEDNQKAY
jgi:hypothetical protein